METSEAEGIQDSKESATELFNQDTDESNGEGLKQVESTQEPKKASDAGTHSIRGDVSAITIGRMLGLATVSEYQLLQGKVELLSTRVQSMVTKMDKVMKSLSSIPTGTDLERIDVQIGALRTLIRDTLADIQESGGSGNTGDSLSVDIKTNSETGEESEEGKEQDNDE